MAEETPFLWAGKVYADPEADISDHIRRQFGDVPFQYPDVASCLDDPSAPDDLMQADLKWDELPDFAALNVCFFRLFSALGSLERSSVWLSRQGWTVDPAREEPHLAHLYVVPRSGLRSFAAPRMARPSALQRPTPSPMRAPAKRLPHLLAGPSRRST